MKLNDLLGNIKRYAIIIGINDYPDAPLKQAVQDADNVNYCLKPNFDKVILSKYGEKTVNSVKKDFVLLKKEIKTLFK